MTSTSTNVANDPEPTSASLLDGLHTVEDAAKLLGFSSRTLREGVNHRGWPHYRMARRLRFDDEQLAEILRMHRHEARVTPTRRPPRRKAS